MRGSLLVRQSMKVETSMKPPSYHELRVPLLKKEVETTCEAMKDHEEAWEKNVCSIMADGWKDEVKNINKKFGELSKRKHVY